jgi:hypothetical protein
MSRQKNRGRPMAAPPSPFDQARDEMFQHVMRCGVIGSEPEHQKEWFDETMSYLAERYHELSKKEIADLRVLGERFAAPTMQQPAEPTSGITAESSEESDAESEESESDASTSDVTAAGELDTVGAA